jgi:hypothetical protein
MLVRRPLAIAAVTCISCACFAQQVQIRLSAFPTMSVADGRSTTTITAEVRDSRGNLVPDGTKVSFESTLGLFREALVSTTGGFARAVLQAGGVPGIATITVKTIDTLSQPSTIEFEFVGDRSDLSSATEYIELVSPGYMEFVPDSRIMAASAPNKAVSIRYRNVVIEADDIQINISRYEVRARNARLKVGKLNREFDELYFKLKDRTGIGTGTFKAILPSPFKMEGFVPRPQTGEPGRYANVGKEVERYGLLNIFREEVTPAPTTDEARRLDFELAVASTSSVMAKKAIIFPQKEIQFQKAEVMVAGNRVMKMPLYSLNLMQLQGSSVVSSMINVSDNQVQVNYPYYLSLRPGQTSLLRFRTGERYGRGGSSSGAFLDYELSWNKGDDMDGKFTVSGIGRKDWSIGVQQYKRLDDRTTAFGMVEVPANQSIYGSLNLSRIYNGFSVSGNASTSQYLRGLRYSTFDTSLVAEKDPTKVGNLPVQLYLGLTASKSSNSLLNSDQTAMGVRARLQSSAVSIGPKTTAYFGMSAAHLTGRNVASGLTLTGEMSLSHRLNSATTIRATYNFLRDGYNDRFLGQHRVGLEARYYTERFQANIFGTKGLDVERMSLYGDMSFGISDSWWLTSTYTLDRYLDSTYLDYTFGLGYRVQGREIGLVWSNSTKRIGLQLLGAQF